MQRHTFSHWMDGPLISPYLYIGLVRCLVRGMPCKRNTSAVGCRSDLDQNPDLTVHPVNHPST